MIKKYILSLLSVVFFVSTSQAKHIDVTEAMNIAKNFCTTSVAAKGYGVVPSDVTMKLSYAEKSILSDEDNVYVFNRSDNGFVIVSADDCAAPVLGYSMNETFDYDNSPCNVKAWLKYYSSQIDYAEANKLSFSGKTVSSASIVVSPLLNGVSYGGYTRNIVWNQGTPYNSKCPQDNNGRCVTGCAATAMAQVLTFYQWPVNGVGSHSYVWNGQTLSVDFSSTAYDWASIFSTEPSSYTLNSKFRNAIGTLMYHCGVSVNMSYSSAGSGASPYDIAPAMLAYFNYDKSIALLLHEYFSETDWENIMKKELDKGRPVLYSGYTKSDEGHIFVCDGYDSSDYFHINWGWGGSGNGYFLLTALDPSQQGIGGSTADLAFNYSQMAFVGIQKPVAGSKPNTQILSDGLPEIDKTISKGGNMNMINSLNKDTVFVTNLSADSVEMNMAYVLFDANGKEVYNEKFFDSDFWFNQPYSYKFYDCYVPFPSSLTDGSYKLYLDYKVTGESAWKNILIPYGKNNCYNVDVKGNSVHVYSATSTSIRSNHIVGKEYDNANKVIYNMNGIRQNSLQHGVNIIRQSDGSVKKVVVR